MSDTGWPVDERALERARQFLDRAGSRVAVACHSDVDGLSAALIVKRAIAARGATCPVIVSSRGEHIHTESMRTKVRAESPSALVVVDMGTRPLPVNAGVPTLVLDHHDAAQGVPPDALVLNSHDRPPVATSSVLAYLLCGALAGKERTCWLAALGALADLGSITPFRSLLDCRAGGRNWTEAVALLNAARRAPADDGATALAVLENASGVEDIALGRVALVSKLHEYRAEVRSELARCSRVAPRRVGDAWLIRFSSGAQVHPVVATKWTRRLAPLVVIAANDGYISGRVNFAMRTAGDHNLLEWMRTLPFRPEDPGEYANGHARATGGSLTPEDFARFLEAVEGRGGTLGTKNEERRTKNENENENEERAERRSGPARLAGSRRQRVKR